jgi:hypothetical protein
LAHSSSLKTTNTSSYLVVLIHEDVSDTHDPREELLIIILHKENSGLQVYEDRFGIEGFDHVPIFHCKDHEPFIFFQGLSTQIVVKKIPCGPSNKEVYAPFD